MPTGSKWVECKCSICGEVIGASSSMWDGGGAALFETHLSWAHPEKLTSDNS